MTDIDARGATARQLRITVTDLATSRLKASVRMPLALVEVGLRIGARLVPEAEGVDLAKVMHAVRSGIAGKVVDTVDSKAGERVELFLE